MKKSVGCYYETLGAAKMGEKRKMVIAIQRMVSSL